MLQHRSYEKELLDGDNLSFAEIRQNMQELDFINRHLGGHRVTLKGLASLSTHVAEGEDLDVLEIGCGGGDNLRFVGKWCAARGRAVRLTGVDINSDCVTYARGRSDNSGINFIHSDYRTAQLPAKPHIIFSSLFCHHFTDDELHVMLQWMNDHAKTGFFINDLHRHPLAYFSIRLLTGFFSRSRLVKHDAPLSVKRGFKRGDWKALMAAAGLKHFSCSWAWAFRWLVILRKE